MDVTGSGVGEAGRTGSVVGGPGPWLQRDVERSGPQRGGPHTRRVMIEEVAAVTCPDVHELQFIYSVFQCHVLSYACIPLCIYIITIQCTKRRPLNPRVILNALGHVDIKRINLWGQHGV